MVTQIPRGFLLKTMTMALEKWARCTATSWAAAWTGEGAQVRSRPGPSPLSDASLFQAPAQPSPPAGASLLWPAFMASSRPACRAASSLDPLAGLVYGLSNEPEVQTAPGGSSWAGAPAWGMSPPRSQALITLPAWALLLAVYLQGGCLPHCRPQWVCWAPGGELGQGNQQRFKAAG